MLPVIDIDPFGDDFLADPYAHHAELRDAGPVFWLERYGIFGMARHAEVSAALQDWQTYSSARGVGLADFAKESPWRPPSLLLEADPPAHGTARRIVNQVVTIAALREARADWTAKAERLVDALVVRRRFDAVKDLAEVFPLSVFPDTIGIQRDGRENLVPYASATFNAFGPRNALFEETARAAAHAIDWINDSCRKENLAPDGWGMKVHAFADTGECSRDEAERLVRSFLTAGLDTTINGIGNLLHAFARNPDQWHLLRAEPTLRKRAFEEALRWDSTVQTFFRTTTRAVDIGDETIPEGSKVLLFLASANRDPRRWADPERFDITRVASGHVGFGFGIHQCLGQMVARQEAEIVLEVMASRIAEIRPAGRAELRLNNTLHALASLPVEVVPA